MINSTAQNLIIQATDFEIPYRGVDLAFRRTYNSYSGHDYTGDDGAPEIGQYGNGWTNTLDAHLSGNNCPNLGHSWGGYYGFSVYDVDGARYDYCFNASGQLVPPPGMQGTTLVSPDGNAFYWTTKTGMQYTFYAPYYTGTNTAYSGRLYRISGRNQNSYLQFNYAWNGSASANANLTYILVTTDNGLLQAKLLFTSFEGLQLCSEVDRPDGAKILYGYDRTGNLLSVSKPAPNNSGIPAVETYFGYGFNLQVQSPRWNASNGTDGGFVAFAFNGGSLQWFSPQVTGIQSAGVMNPGPSYLNDTTNTYLQPGGVTGLNLYRFESVTGSATNSAYSDTDGHQSVQYFDPTGRATTRKQWTGSQWLTTSQGWDTNNDQISTTDARGNETDYAYDLAGNTIGVARPLVTVSSGTFRPTTLFSYDAYNNIVARCDPDQTHALSLDWTSAPTGDAACPTSSTSATRQSWIYPSYEPYGELNTETGATTLAAPTGYVQQYVYNAAKQGGVADYGLWTLVEGTATSDAGRQPLEHRWYDASGNNTCSNRDGATDFWLIAYDSLERVTSVADADDDTVGAGPCGRTGGLSTAGVPWSTARTATYYPDGSISSSQSASERAAGLSTTYAYDVDGDQTRVATHNGCVISAGCSAGVVTNWYDGADRLVEVMEPQDPTDYYAYPWLTRYLYDLTGSQGTVAFHGTSYLAHGNLFKAQQYVGPPPTPLYGTTTWTDTGWTDISGTAFDPLDRPVVEYKVTPATSAAAALVSTATRTYDATGALGLLSSWTDAISNSDTLTYDNDGNTTSQTFSGTLTPSESYTYDPVGRLVDAHTSVFGDDKRSYDLAGELTSRTEPALGGVTDPVKLTYGYFEDGKKASVTVVGEAGAVAGFSATQPTKTYSYRTDGTLSAASLYFNGVTYPFAWTFTAGGRTLTRSDPYAAPAYQYSYNAAGLTQSFTLPNVSFTNVSYDAESDPVALSTLGTTTRNAFSTRGELLGESFGTDSCAGPGAGQALPAAWHNAKSANGYLFPLPPCPGAPFPSDGWDHEVGTILNATEYGTDTPVSNGIGYYYDNSGEISSTSQLTEESLGGVLHFCTSTGSRAYDANDHVASVSQVQQLGFNCTNYYMRDEYQWGTNGHPILISASPLSTTANPAYQWIHTLHWDGDELLFDSNADSTVRAAWLDGLAEATPSAPPPAVPAGLSVFDYTLAGAVVDLRSSSALHTISASNGLTSAFQTRGGSEVGAFDFISQDMLGDGVIQLTGDRTYETGTTQWSSPDRASGGIGDPISQDPYIFKRSNPYLYRDKSGNDINPDGIEIPLAFEDQLFDVTIGISNNAPPPPDRGPVQQLMDLTDFTTALAGRGRPHPPRPPRPPPIIQKLLQEQHITVRKLPTGTKPIDQTVWKKDHRIIKRFLLSGAADKTSVSPNGDVWIHNNDGTYTNKGNVHDILHH